MKKTLITMSFLVFSVFAIVASPSLGGMVGYVVVPSAEVVPSAKNPAVNTAYSATFTGSQAVHIPSLAISFSDRIETSFAVDIADNTDLLLGGKWRFSKTTSSSYAAGVLLQLSDVTNTNKVAAQLYVASTFESSIMDLPSKTTILLGYTFKEQLNSNIDFALAFQTPLLPDTFKGNVDLLLDFGNVSYSTTPSAGKAENRGMVNVGLRLNPLEILPSVYFGLDIRAMDLFDHIGRAVSIGTNITFRP